MSRRSSPIRAPAGTIAGMTAGMIAGAPLGVPLAMVAVALLAGCGAMRAQDASVVLGDTLRVYEQSVRWGDWQTVAAMIERRGDGSAAAAEDGRPELQGLKVVTSNIRTGQVRPELGDVPMRAVFEYYYADSPRLRSVVQEAVWWYDRAEREWHLDGDLPAFRR